MAATGKARRARFLGGLIIGGLVGAAGASLYGRRAEIASWDGLGDRGLLLGRRAQELATRGREGLTNLAQRSAPIGEKAREILRSTVERGQRFTTRAQDRFARVQADTPEGVPSQY